MGMIGGTTMTVRKCRTCGTKHNGLLCPKGCDVVPQPGHGPFLFRVQVQHEVPLGTYAGKDRIVRSFYDVMARADTPVGAMHVARDVHNESDKTKQYKVVCHYDRTWKCSCPHWIYRLKGRSACKHISMTKIAIRYLEGISTHEEEQILLRYLQGKDE